MNPIHEILFLVATQWIELSMVQKMNVGIKLGLIDFSDFCYSEKMITQMIFVDAYKKNKIAGLVKEIEQVKHGNG